VRTELEAALRQKYHHYVDQSFTKLLVFRITRLTGWSASA
jgi:hypothetical protein